jgi:hypothetical protein
MESISEYGAAVDVDLVELFRDLIRFETELWDRVEFSKRTVLR